MDTIIVGMVVSPSLGGGGGGGLDFISSERGAEGGPLSLSCVLSISILSSSRSSSECVSYLDGSWISSSRCETNDGGNSSDIGVDFGSFFCSISSPMFPATADSAISLSSSFSSSTRSC